MINHATHKIKYFGVLLIRKINIFFSYVFTDVRNFFGNQIGSNYDICFIGSGRKMHARVANLLEGFKKNHITVTHIPIRYANSREALKMRNSRHVFSLNYHFKFWGNLVPRILYENIYAFFALLFYRKKIKISKFLFLSEFSNYIVFTVKFFAFFYRKPIIFDAHGSLYYQRIIGVGDYPENSIYAKILFHIDRMCALSVDKYITLSNSYANILSSTFCIKKERFISVYIGHKELEFSKKNYNINVDIIQLSSNQPFHGLGNAVDIISYIARIEKNIKTLITGDKSYNDLIQNLGLQKNIENRRIEGSEKNKYMNSTKLIFGPLGKSEINTIDFSTKMNEALAFGKVLVTLNTPSARELLQDGFNAILIDIDKLELSADKIIETLQNQKKRKLMEAESYKTYCTFLRPEIIVGELVKYIRQFPN